MTKNCLFLFTLLFLAFTSGKVHARPCARFYNDSISLFVEQVEEFPAFATGNFSARPKRGYKFIGVYLQLTNKTGESQEVDLKSIFLADTAYRVKYAPEYVMQTGLITFLQKSRKQIKSGDSLHRRLVYCIPEDLYPTYLFYNDTRVAVKIK
ncbi:hypothetical protein V9K67_08680 [Paraflavisolibacter sp. H34]|uniref:hypothetical protein n=1 Tax=Huijunlia imazamoxiresistens TaxID=3127457 RepID=UPI0030189D20